MHYIIGYNRQNHKYVLLNPDLECVIEFEWAKDMLQYYDVHGYEYVIL